MRGFFLDILLFLRYNINRFILTFRVSELFILVKRRRVIYMNMSEYLTVKDYTYLEYCDYLQEK